LHNIGQTGGFTYMYIWLVDVW